MAPLLSAAAAAAAASSSSSSSTCSLPARPSDRAGGARAAASSSQFHARIRSSRRMHSPLLPMITALAPPQLGSSSHLPPPPPAATTWSSSFLSSSSSSRLAAAAAAPPFFFRQPRYKGSIQAFGSVGGGKSSVPAADRILAAVGYFLPFFDGLQYGRYVFAQYPAAQSLFAPLFPLLRVYTSIPFANFVAFFTLYLAVVRNPSFSRYVRFNSMQACVMDVLIILPLIVQRILSPRSGIGLDLLVISYNTVFIFLVICFVFGVVSCLLGKTPRLPIVADAADNQLL